MDCKLLVPDEALDHSRRSIELDPHNALLHSLYGISLLFTGQIDAAISEFLLSQKSAPRNFVNFNGLNWAYWLKGDLESANEVRIAKARSVGDDAGEVEKTLDWMERAFEIGGPGMPYIGVSHHGTEIAKQERFKELLRQMNLEMWLDS